MPDSPVFSKRSVEAAPPPPLADPEGPPYAELRCRTNFSFLEGASHPDELVARAVELGYAALAVTDRNSLCGVVRAHAAAKSTPLKLIVGAEVTPADAPPLVLWAPDRAAYGRLCQLLTLGRRRAEKGTCQLSLRDIYQHADGLLAGVAPDGADFYFDWAAFREAFGDRGYLLVDLQRDGDDRARLAAFDALARRVQAPLVAVGNTYYHDARRQPLHDVLTAIRHGVTLAEADGRELFGNAQRHLRSRRELERLFRDRPEVLARSVEVADRCGFSLSELRYEYPAELTPAGKSERQWLHELTWRGAAERYPGGVPAKVDAMLRHELTLIGKLQYEAYFLTVWDIVRFARSQGILCQGRGSAANSAVCYCLGVTSVDPEHSELLFERFISAERNEPPDIDVDMEHERREEVLQYVYAKYGRERAALAATVITYRVRSAIRDAGKALGLSVDRVDALAKQVDGWAYDAKLPDRFRQAGVDPASPLGARLLSVVEQLVGFPRHLSQHVGGMVMTRGLLCEMVPIENAAMADRTIVQWDKDDIEELGILKVDCLALGMLTAIRKAFDLIALHTGRRWTLATIPAEDPAVYEMICRADTMGVFQIESRAQMTMLPRLRPRKFYDLVIEVAIVRPGPIQGDMVHPYLKRRNGEEPVSYPNDAIRAVLERTLGVPIFQEQAMKLAEVAAGFTPGEADQLRRAMASWRSGGKIDHYRQKLLDGMRANGLDEQFAERCYRQLQGFGEYGFPESHAASFALLVYASCWLKCWHPAAFCAALLNSQPMGFYSPSQLVRDARAHDVGVLPVDVNYSDYDCTLEPQAESLALRLGLRMVSGLSESAARRLVEARQAGPYAKQHELERRAKLDRRAMSCLAAADAFGSMRVDRRQAQWHALAQESDRAARPLFDDLDDDEPLIDCLPQATPLQQTLADYQSLGLSLRPHPLTFFREQLAKRRVVPAEELQQTRSGARVAVAGLVLLRQRPGTAKGITFATLEDETGLANLIIRPHVWERYYSIARRSNAWIAHGELQHAEGVIHLLVRRLEAFSSLRADNADDLRFASRDFH
ncbi:Error-prone DNA polymerase [Posidoniimonas polymericola]|uniref:Error-prone DNA polymerase n=1 Tax=Posidoniimonas polymericola TaxID=2528002 RepID=A0A5C5XX35_9BACT|nr:error-prone DNA polymerase [Posidoniimonas polymericola]TWT66913.1 Error-prone DNA polymerase [Posidoniimonas polymericola]